MPELRQEDKGPAQGSYLVPVWAKDEAEEGWSFRERPGLVVGYHIAPARKCLGGR